MKKSVNIIYKLLNIAKYYYYYFYFLKNGTQSFGE